ncbi:MAG TPA: hypothetical protein VMM18_12980 [Gemmatimonadaceae bacterium]|nr:hypothetical protein [Gemmatimonadaceae bacterium]
MARSLAYTFTMAIAVTLAGATPGPVRGQTPAPGIDQDSVQGRLDGAAAANEHPVGGRFVLGFLGGLPVVVLGMPALGDVSAQQIVPVIAGLGIVIGAAATGSAAPPPELGAEADARGTTYGAAYREAYAERLGARRGGAAILGGVAGTTAGCVVIIWMFKRSFGGS